MDMNVYDAWLFSFTLVESVAIIVGNGFLVLTFVRHRKLLNAMNCYIFSMCISGLVTGFLVPLGFGNSIGPYTVTGPYMSKCDSQKAKAIIFYATACNSIMCMLAIAVERWRTLASSNGRISHRVPAGITSKLTAFICWIVSLSYGMAYIFLFEFKEMPVQYNGSGTNSCYMANQTDCSSFEFCFLVDDDDDMAGRARARAELYHIITLVILFIVPILAISVIYAVLVHRLLRSAQKSEKANRGSCSIHRAKLRAIQAMILV